MPKMSDKEDDDQYVSFVIVFTHKQGLKCSSQNIGEIREYCEYLNYGKTRRFKIHFRNLEDNFQLRFPASMNFGVLFTG
jgi:hypothetical protein